MKASNHDIDILIIGGGIIGLSIAYYLSKRKFSNNVQIIERDSMLASHASGHNAGGISSAHIFQTNKMSLLARETLKLFQDLAQKDRFDFDFKINGAINILKEEEQNPKDIERLEVAIKEFQEKSNTKVQLVSGAETNEIEPNLALKDNSHALYYPEDAQGNSKKLADCFARSCTDRGVQISTQTAVEDFEIESGGRTIRSTKTNKGIIYAKTVVLATGPWSGQVASMLGLDIPIRPIKGHLISSHNPGKKVLNTFVSGENYYVLQTAEGNLVVGGGEDTDGFNSSLIKGRVDEAWNECVSFVPLLRDLGQESASACLRPYASGGLPVIGMSTKIENLIFATGHFRNGFSLAPVTGKIVSELTVDLKTDFEIAPFSPKRFGV